MNDSELDEMLDRWEAPGPRPELRERVNAGYHSTTPARPRGLSRWLRLPAWEASRGVFAGVAAGAVVFLLVIGVAYPQSLTRVAAGPIPFTVDSEYIDFHDDGSSAVTEYATTFLRDGHEWVLAGSYPGSALMTLHLQLISSVHLMLYSIIRPFEDTGDLAKVNGQRIQNGCLSWGEKAAAHQKLIGQESVLNHRVSVIQTTDEDWRYTQWLAPDLGCFPLKARYEKLLADGTYRPVDGRLALKINVNR